MDEDEAITAVLHRLKTAYTATLMDGTQAWSSRTSRSTASDDVREVLDSIRRIVRLLRLSSRDAERRVGLSGAQLFVLQKLSEAGSLSVNALAQRTHTHQSSVSVVAQALVDRGLVARSRASDDARRVDLSLTPAANALLRKSPGAAQDRLIAAIERLSGGARRQLALGLARLVEEAGLNSEEPTMMFDDPPAPRSSRPRARSASRRR